jgi:adenylylsulfate kinase
MLWVLPSAFSRVTVPWRSLIKANARRLMNSDNGIVVWLSGLSGAGKSTLCQTVSDRLSAECRRNIVLDGDSIRMGLCSDLGFSMEDRIENVRRVAHVAKLLSSASLIVLVAVMSPVEATRQAARQVLPDLLQVFVDASLENCEARDIKGLYAKARSGALRGFTGIGSPFESPKDAQLTCHTDKESVQESTNKILQLLRASEAEQEAERRRTIAVDFDGVISNYDGWKGPNMLGAPREDVRLVLHNLRADGWKIIIHTTRSGDSIISYLQQFDIPFDEINENSDYKNAGHKPVATVYWDDRALRYSGDALSDIAAIRSFRTWSGRA